MINFNNEFEKMLKAYRKYPWIFSKEVNNIEEKLQLLSDIENKWNESGCDKMQYQVEVSRYSIPRWNGLAFYIDNLSVSQTHDLHHITITYYDEFVDQIKEYFETGRVYYNSHYEA